MIPQKSVNRSRICGCPPIVAFICVFSLFSGCIIYASLSELAHLEEVFSIHQPFELQPLTPSALAFATSRLPVEDIKRLIQYWNNADNQDKTPKPLNREKFLTWHAWPAGLNNRRISFEVAYCFAHLLNRTLILPPIDNMGARQGYPARLDYESIFDERDLRSGVSVLTATEWDNYPKLEKTKIALDTFELPWKIGNGNKTVFVVPEKVGPQDSKLENEEFDKFWNNRQENKEHHVVDQYTLGPRFLEATNLEFKRDAIFMHFYYAFYFRESSKFVEVNKLIRDHVHFPDASTEYAARIVHQLGGPEGFSAMHFRRDDLQFEDQRKVSPAQVFNTTFDYYSANDTIYVSTDEVPEVFDKEFCSIFGKRYRILTLRNFSKYVLKAPKVYIPMIEMQIASQAKIFVGTQLSTFSMYITRMRGYSKHIRNKSYLMTTGWNWYHFPRHVDWDMEHEEAWDNLK